MVDESTYKNLLKDIARVEQYVSLSRFNGLGTGGRAAYFTEAKDAMEMAGAVKAAIDNSLPYEIIGEATSILFPDEDFAGLVIHNMSDGFVMATDRSQMVVESGMSLPRFITLAAGRGYGGMTQFYSKQGSIGGAVYHNLTVDDVSILSSVRHVTVLMPPTKMKPYPTVVRQRADWLLREDGKTKLRHQKTTRGIIQPYPVILNVQFQLTSVRPDEIQRRIQKEASLPSSTPGGDWFGPIFIEPKIDQSLADLLKYSGVSKIQVDGVRPDKHYLNFLKSKRGATSKAIWKTAEAMRQQVLERSGIELEYAFERLGDWSGIPD